MKELLRFDCFDQEPHYHYAPLEKNERRFLDKTTAGNPLGWALKQLRTRLPEMLEHAGYGDVASRLDRELVAAKLDEAEEAARSMAQTQRRIVIHKRGDQIVEAGNVRFGLEYRETGGDRGVAVGDVVPVPVGAVGRGEDVPAAAQERPGGGVVVRRFDQHDAVESGVGAGERGVAERADDGRDAVFQVFQAQARTGSVGVLHWNDVPSGRIREGGTIGRRARTDHVLPGGTGSSAEVAMRGWRGRRQSGPGHDGGRHS